MNTIFTESRVMKTLTVIALIVTFSNSYAQTYVPFPTENARWKGSETNHEAYWVTNEIRTSGDTLINNIVYTKLIKKELFYPWNNQGIPFSTPVFSEDYLGSFRNDSVNKKVYFIAKDSVTESIWYDFDLQIGDSLPNYGITGKRILAIDSVAIDGIYRRRFVIDSCTSIGQPTASYLIEGIGSTYGLISKGICPFESSEELKCVKVAGRVVFNTGIGSDSTCATITSVKEAQTKGSNVMVYPNPTNNFLHIKLATGSNSPKEIVIRNYSGMEVLRVNMGTKSIQEIDVSNFTDGFYIYQVVFKSDNATISGSFVKN